jgi:4-hydroxy-tetrahydrodipicolinate synthase
MVKLTGIISALVTPFDKGGELDLDAMTKNVRHQQSCGVRSFCPLGGTGEPISMTDAERRRVVDTVRSEVGGEGRVVVGCLLPSQREIIELGRYAKSAGAEAIMVIPPYFVGAKPRHVKRHFCDIAEKVDLPMVLFNGPTRAGVRLEAEFVLELARDIPHFVAIKEATGDMNAVGKILREAPQRFAMLQGYDELVLPTLAGGGVGAIVSLACLVPSLLARLEEACRAGDLAIARNLQNLVSELGEPIYAEPNPAPLKHAMNAVGLSGGFTRPPLYPISEATAAHLDRILPRIMAEERQG